ncbi:hypothetical protein A3Q56_03942 [Intoshia linei]|uniref:Uncharacterized protein n=1 Tax=Intoshia linei TaxID=1819745 RepID=A0A177B4H8_9BILA|nr:hypothetical protein A3Q56_03942 [Intoshia linei]
MNIFGHSRGEEKNMFQKLTNKINECFKEAQTTKKIFDKKIKDDGYVLSSNQHFIETISKLLEPNPEDVHINENFKTEMEIYLIQDMLIPKKQKISDNEFLARHIEQYCHQLMKIKDKIIERNKLFTNYEKLCKEIIGLEKKIKKGDEDKLDSLKANQDTGRTELSHVSDLLFTEMKNAIIAHSSYIRNLIKFSVYHINDQSITYKSVMDKILSFSEEREKELLAQVQITYDVYAEEYLKSNDSYIDNKCKQKNKKNATNKKLKKKNKTINQNDNKELEVVDK